MMVKQSQLVDLPNSSKGLSQMLQMNSSLSDFMKDLKGELLTQIRDEAAPKDKATMNEARLDKVDVSSGQSSSDSSQNIVKQETSTDAESVVLQGVQQSTEDNIVRKEQSAESVDSNSGHDQTSTYDDMCNMQDTVVNSRAVDIESILLPGLNPSQQTSDGEETCEDKEDSNTDQESSNEQDTSTCLEVQAEENSPSQDSDIRVMKKVSSFPIENLDEDYYDNDTSSDNGQRALLKVPSFPLDNLDDVYYDDDHMGEPSNKQNIQKVLNREISFEEFEGLPSICCDEENNVGVRQLKKICSHPIQFEEEGDEVNVRQLKKVFSHPIQFNEEGDEHVLDEVTQTLSDNVESSSYGSNEVEVEVSQTANECD
eukprot:TRINITY_DN1689_c0_g1_i6.p1 TRINITY_DN1689_c0_g1~~TRINITY_DN1689_c0_g1_i6.p1  ORF type:complete len:392 (-),score=51.14 TRINITY_DN1689_c0_g1_i6:411-1520(-)